MLYAVIMAGGSGTRFWPESRRQRPKQLLRMAGERTMIRVTVDRLAGFVPPGRILIATTAALAEQIAAELPDLPPGAILAEPCKRNTAPCIGLAAFHVLRDDPEATMAVMPADHVIEPAETFRDCIRFAADLVSADPRRIITLGVPPTYAAESFGYIERGARLSPLPPGEGQGEGEMGMGQIVGTESAGVGDPGRPALTPTISQRERGTPPQSPTPNPQPLTPPVYHVQRFHEKPAAETARQYLEAGKYYWNAGIFVWKARTIVEALARYEPDLHQRLERIAAAVGRPGFDQVLAAEFAAMRSVSIDYAVMERAENVLVIETPFRWDDVGSWQALARLHGADADGNTVLARHLGLDTEGTIVRAGDDHLIVTMGLHDCLIVHTPDTTLVANKHSEEAVRRVVELLEERGWDAYL